MKSISYPLACVCLIVVAVDAYTRLIPDVPPARAELPAHEIQLTSSANLSQELIAWLEDEVNEEEQVTEIPAEAVDTIVESEQEGELLSLWIDNHEYRLTAVFKDKNKPSTAILVARDRENNNLTEQVVQVNQNLNGYTVNNILSYHIEMTSPHSKQITLNMFDYAVGTTL